ncbi:metallophosphatase family protein [Patescibacteria group bacterium]|nr:metallophosphatase family protein [Patescibacteria group bacterium]
MRFAIISDVHGNYVALQAVLSDIRARGGVDQMVCLGDVVGYGPQPRECVIRIQLERIKTVLGNHEAAVLDSERWARNFNQIAKEAVRFTALALQQPQLDYLDGLPDCLWDEDHGLAFTHASFSHPATFFYVEGSVGAGIELKRLPHDDLRVFFVGHTHEPQVFGERSGSFYHQTELVLSGDERFLINVGSVGQPRDDDPRACYGLLDTSDWSFSLPRVEYDVAAVVRQIAELGLPSELGQRLLIGY